MRMKAVGLLALCGLLFSPQLVMAQHDAWVATWAASPEPGQDDATEPLLNIENQTVRERVRVSVGGPQIRLQLSNECGSAALQLGAVTVAMPNSVAAIQPASVHAVTFENRSAVTIPAGAPILSDPINFPVKAGTEISISLYFPKRVSSVTWHLFALKHAVVSTAGDHTRDKNMQGNADSDSSIALSAVLVPAQTSQRLIATFGDSLIDGNGSSDDADRNLSGDLARRLQSTSEGSQLAVVNEGVGGNRLLSNARLPFMGDSALARFDRDVLSLPGLTHIVLFEGLNDIGFPGGKLGKEFLADPADARTAEDVINAYRQLIARAHARGIKVIGCTLIPFEGANSLIPGYYTEEKGAVREQVNQWIRSSGVFDGVIDIDKVLRDPDHPGRVAERFAGKDHLHPNDAGYQAITDSIDLSLFR
ncbi:MAG TPA: SGNH/GDSL hydrolase family protein [Candidatus Koribacter sp.]